MLNIKARGRQAHPIALALSLVTLAALFIYLVPSGILSTRFVDHLLPEVSKHYCNVEVDFGPRQPTLHLDGDDDFSKSTQLRRC